MRTSHRDRGRAASARGRPEQSAPLASRAALVGQMRATAQRFWHPLARHCGVTTARPAHSAAAALGCVPALHRRRRSVGGRCRSPARSRTLDAHAHGQRRRVRRRPLVRDAPQPLSSMTAAANGSDVLLACESLDVIAGARLLVDALDLQVRSGEFLAVLGCNGSGKSLTLQTLAGLRAPAAGHIDLQARALRGLARRDVGALPRIPAAGSRGGIREHCPRVGAGGAPSAPEGLAARRSA